MIIAWVISLIAVFWLGYFARDVNNRVVKLEDKIKQKADKPVEESPSILVDPTDEVQNAQYELEQMQKRLNRGQDSRSN